MTVREDFDVLFDHIAERLESYAAAQAAEDELFGFHVRPDNVRALGEPTYPAWVIPRLEQTSFEAETSAVGEAFGMVATYDIDCIVRAGKTTERAGRVAFARLRYLATQVVRALWVRDDWDLGMPHPIQRAEPSINWIGPEIQQTERVIVGATVSLEAGLSWDLASPTTEAGSVEWAALYE